MEPLGITFDVKSFERTTMYAKCNEPEAHVAICLGPAWGKDFPDGYTFADPLFGSAPSSRAAATTSSSGRARTCCRRPATPSRTSRRSTTRSRRRTSRRVTPASRRGRTSTRTLMEDVVPWAPYLFDNNVDITSQRIVNYSFDQFAGLAAYDAYAIAPDAQ
jgi:hypothetical protein